jgi:hypothetical protein
MRDNLYDEFYDPSEDIFIEPRAFCYDLATQLICQAKYVAGNELIRNNQHAEQGATPTGNSAMRMRYSRR